MSDPNFPAGLDIRPSSSSLKVTSVIGSDDGLYGYAAQEKAIQEYGIAGRIWEAAYAFILYLDPPTNLLFDPPFPARIDPKSRTALTMIELGSGSGLVGSTISRSLTPNDVLVLTDLAEVCPLLETNVKNATNRSEEIYVRPLAWGSSEDADEIARELLQNRPLTHILCSDLVYFPELLAPLLRSLIHLSSLPGPTHTPIQIIISYKIRSLPKEAPFWSAFGLWFTYEPLLEQRASADGLAMSWTRYGADMEGPTFIFVARRQPQSFDWDIPVDDQDLLAGVGAGGTLQAKGSDYFENLLFMSLQEDSV